MNELELMLLISEGESERLDLKRELHLDTKANKGEFIKDVISIANSAPNNKGYLLIGVDKDKIIVGIDEIEEERIQQVVHTYIRPVVSLKCSTLPSGTTKDPKVIGVIEITGVDRPYRVTRPVGNLEQDHIFVRHGSVVAKATFEELEQMRRETQVKQEAQRFFDAAEINMTLGNFDDAISAYSKAIEVIPTANLFYARGVAYKQYAVLVRKSKKLFNELLNRAFKDLSNAIRLADTNDFEKSARFERFRIFEIDSSYYDGWIQDCDWLKENTEGVELGEVLFIDCKAREDEAGITSSEPETILKELNYAVKLGYKSSELYEIRAHANFYLHNYGLALEDINTALQKLENTERAENILCLKANIEAIIGRFDESYESFKKARHLSSNYSKFHDSWGYIEGNADASLWKFCLNREFGGQKLNKTLQAVFQALLIKVISKEFTRVTMRGDKILSTGSVIAGKASIEKEFPKLIPTIIEMVGEEFWEKCDNIAQHESLVWRIDQE